MKKLLAIFILMAAFIIGCGNPSNAQMLTTNLSDGYTYANVTRDYTVTNTTPVYWQINAAQDWYTAQTVVISLDTLVSGQTNMAVALFGRASDQLAWSAIGSAVNWKYTTGDTVITITNATESIYRQFKLLFTGTGTGTTTIDRMEFKQYFGLP